MATHHELPENEIQALCTRLMETRQPQKMRDLELRTDIYQWHDLLVISPSIIPFMYRTYFWWAHTKEGRIRRGHRPSKEKVHEYWFQILMQLNKDPLMLLEEHQRLGAACLYRYRPESRHTCT